MRRARCARLSDLADACVGAAIDFLLLDAHRQGKLELAGSRTSPACGSGWIVLGMGKLGARELNYSSDIDLIVFFDPEAPAVVDPDGGDRPVRAPDAPAGAHPAGPHRATAMSSAPTCGCVPIPARRRSPSRSRRRCIYYEGRGQNWERAAMIKARPVAGDIAAGDAFLSELQPYVWRKYLDYAAIADIHSIKRQIHAHKGHGEIAVKGHNVKLGRGGIREIEFFVQTQQLIAGGRFPELRGRAHRARCLANLPTRGWITADARDALTAQYWFLRARRARASRWWPTSRRTRCPKTTTGWSASPACSASTTRTAFPTAFRASLQKVERPLRGAVRGRRPSCRRASAIWSSPATSTTPIRCETLSRLGFERPSDICRVIRSWHFGRYRATQSAEARERLTELTPALLRGLRRDARAPTRR